MMEFQAFAPNKQTNKQKTHTQFTYRIHTWIMQSIDQVLTTPFEFEFFFGCICLYPQIDTWKLKPPKNSQLVATSSELLCCYYIVPQISRQGSQDHHGIRLQKALHMIGKQQPQGSHQEAFLYPLPNWWLMLPTVPSHQPTPTPVSRLWTISPNSSIHDDHTTPKEKKFKHKIKIQFPSREI